MASGITLSKKEVQSQIELLKDFDYNIKSESEKIRIKDKLKYLREKVSESTNAFIVFNKKQAVSLIELMEDLSKVCPVYSINAETKIKIIRKELLK